MQAGDAKVNIGGLMRCCTSTLMDWTQANENTEVTEGQTLDCKFEAPDNKNMIFEGGVWRWNSPPWPASSKS